MAKKKVVEGLQTDEFEPEEVVEAAPVPEHFVEIGKLGEPENLHIHPDALAEHVKLGWSEIKKVKSEE